MFVNDKHICTCLVVMNVVVIGVVVLGMEDGCEVKWEVGEQLRYPCRTAPHVTGQGTY